jgi:ribulose-phosphate 3-epimerase
MAIIAPTITVETEAEYRNSIENFGVFAERIHIDISDGEFAPTFLLSEDKLWWPDTVEVDIHAMVKRPSEHLSQLIAKKPRMVIFHAEVEEDLAQIFQYLKQNDIKTGLALLRPTVPTSLAHLIGVVDHVMIFSGDLGRTGGVASMMQLEKVRLIKAIRTDVEIGWDGGVSVENAFTLAQGGVDVLNAGSAIATSSDPQQTYARLVSEINKRGVI